MFYLYNGLPEDVTNLETIEDLIFERFKAYGLPANLQYDTEQFQDEISHLFMCIIALDCPDFKETFLKGETKIFVERLKRKDYAKLERGLSAACHHLNNLSQIEEAKNVKFSQLKWLSLVKIIMKTLLDKSAHVFKITHLEKCRKVKLTMPFTFPTKFVAKREVEVKNGKVSFSCGKWNMVLELVFEYLLKLELVLMEKCQALEYVIYKSEDDRLRQIIRRFTNLLGGRVDIEQRIIKAEDVDEEARYFPPCMANLHQILRQTHRLSYASRFQYLLFLKDIGLPVNENVLFWEGEYSKPALGSSCTHEWEEKQKRYTYQVHHLYGLSGCHKLKTSHPCAKFIRDLESKMDGGCPFQHLTEHELRNAIPERIMSLPDVEDIFSYKSHNMPQKACAVYLKCQGKVGGGGEGRRRDEMQINANKIIYVVSPLQYYQTAKSLSDSLGS